MSEVERRPNRIISPNEAAAGILKTCEDAIAESGCDRERFYRRFVAWWLNDPLNVDDSEKDNGI